MLAPKSVAAQETWTLLVDSWSSSAAAAGAAKTAKTSIRSSSSRLLETRHEARNILQQAIVLERRLERSDKRSIDFIAYAQFCAKLIDLFKLRQKISDLKIELFLAAKRDLVMLANRAFRIYIFRNQGDYEMWKAYLDFNKEFGSKKQISKIYARILNIHSLNIEAIREAIEWEFIDMKNFETARGLLQKYLDRDPTNSILWSTYLQLEISFVETLNKDKRFGSNLGVTSENLNELMQGSLVREVAKEIRNNSILQVRIDSSKFSKKIATEFSEVLDESWLSAKDSQSASEGDTDSSALKQLISSKFSMKNLKDIEDIIKKFSCEFDRVSNFITFEEKLEFLQTFFDKFQYRFKKVGDFKDFTLRLFNDTNQNHIILSFSLFYYLFECHSKDLLVNWNLLFKSYCELIKNSNEFTDCLIQTFNRAASDDSKFLVKNSMLSQNENSRVLREILKSIINDLLDCGHLQTTSHDSYDKIIQWVWTYLINTDSNLISRISTLQKSKSIA